MAFHVHYLHCDNCCFSTNDRKALISHYSCHIKPEVEAATMSPLAFPALATTLAAASDSSESASKSETLIWARLKGYPWWPARTLEGDRVMWFGECSTSKIKSNEYRRPFCDFFTTFYNGSNRVAFKVAVGEALKECYKHTYKNMDLKAIDSKDLDCRPSRNRLIAWAMSGFVGLLSKQITSDAGASHVSDSKAVFVHEELLRSTGMCLKKCSVQLERLSLETMLQYGYCGDTRMKTEPTNHISTLALSKPRRGRPPKKHLLWPVKRESRNERETNVRAMKKRRVSATSISRSQRRRTVDSTCSDKENAACPDWQQPAVSSDSAVTLSYSSTTLTSAGPARMTPRRDVIIYQQKKILRSSVFECVKCSRQFNTLSSAMPHFIANRLCTVSPDDMLPLYTYYCFQCHRSFCCKNGCLKHQLRCAGPVANSSCHSNNSNWPSGAVSSTTSITSTCE